MSPSAPLSGFSQAAPDSSTLEPTFPSDCHDDLDTRCDEQRDVVREYLDRQQQCDEHTFLQ